MRAKGFTYSLTYKNADGEEKTHIKDMDYFYIRYCYIILSESEDKYRDLTVLRHTTNANGDTVTCIIDPTRRDSVDVNFCLLGCKEPNLDERYSRFISTEGEADAYARGIELGIARSASMLDSASCNTDDEHLSSILREQSEEILIHAPAYHAQYKVLTAALAENAKLTAQLLDIKTKAHVARSEFQSRLGVTPQFGIMNLEFTRELLDKLVE